MKVSSRVLFAGAVVAIALSTFGAPAGTQPTVAQRFRDLVTAKARAAGLDPAAVLSAPMTIHAYGADGVARSFVRPFGEIIDGISPPGAADAIAASGPLGTPEYVGGNITDVFGTAWAGSTAEAPANCQSVTVKQSATIPNTYTVASQIAGAAGVPLINPVPVTGLPLFLTPVPSTLSPIIPASSWILPAYAWLGPTLHIKARYTAGLHEVGTLIGSNASTATDAPSPYPIWAPMTTHAFIEDHSVDFLGQAWFVHGETRTDIPLLGSVCFGVGAIVASNGAAIFDNHKVLGADIGFPDIP